MRSFNSFLTESILDPEKPTLSPQVFDLDDAPRLKPDVREQILSGIQKLSKNMKVVDYTLIGSTLTKRYTDDSDIDINILISGSSSDMEAAKSIASKNSGVLLNGTLHPINYHVLNDKKDFDNANDSADGVFDISNNKFIRKATDAPFHVEKYFDEFKKTVSKIENIKKELKGALIDYSFLKTMRVSDVEHLNGLIKNKLAEIEVDAQHLSVIHTKIIMDRNAGFQKPLSASDIKKYGAKNRLPANVIYKLLERNHYLDFLHQVDKILDDGKITDKEAGNLLDVVS